MGGVSRCRHSNKYLKTQLPGLRKRSGSPRHIEKIVMEIISPPDENLADWIERHGMKAGEGKTTNVSVWVLIG
jgi:hypothetical protein